MADKYDIILSGVGGQGVLSVAAVISIAAMKDGYTLRQSEVHGMAQRGGAVLAHMRVSKTTIASDLIPRGSADVVLSMEPMESLRYVDFLKPEGRLISAAAPYENIPDYPDLDKIHEKINSLKSSRIIDAKALAKEAGTMKAVNMVMVGALSAELEIRKESIIEAVKENFASKGEKIIEANLKAFELGRIYNSRKADGDKK
ncbi:MAG: indolepyruvate oxidoreductase subunit beta [Spirochaetales bacterium]|nr:indolepyruvate oxidoreductase subunit beta [Spirochaetales bacterium]